MAKTNTPTAEAPAAPATITVVVCVEKCFDSQTLVTYEAGQTYRLSAADVKHLQEIKHWKRFAVAGQETLVQKPGSSPQTAASDARVTALENEIAELKELLKDALRAKEPKGDKE